MSKHRPRRSPQRCENCGDPLGDSEAMVVTGVDSGRVHYVHRPSTVERAMCFRFSVNGAEKQRIALKTPPVWDREASDIQLANELRLDRTACEALGLSWPDVLRIRRERGAR